jgi:antitoxin ParD1/3/4
MATMNVSLTTELINVIKRKVSSGMYNNSSEVIREAIRRFDEYEELLYGLKLDKLKTEIAIGLQQADQSKYSNRTVEEIIVDAKSRKKRKNR